MAFTRKMLKAMGIEDEKIDEIIEAHTEVTDGLKDQVKKYKEDAEKLADVQKELDDLKANTDDGYEQKYKDLKKDFDEYKTTIENEKAFTAKENAYRELLKAAGVKEKFIDTIIRADKTVIDGLKLGEDGKIDGAETLTANAKQNWSDFVATTTTQTAGVETPPANNGSVAKSKAEIYKMENGRYVLSAAERQAELAKLYEQGEK